MTRYQELADDIEASITAGVLCPGDKLPSVRQTSGRRGVSARPSENKVPIPE